MQFCQMDFFFLEPDRELPLEPTLECLVLDLVAAVQSMEEGLKDPQFMEQGTKGQIQRGQESITNQPL